MSAAKPANGRAVATVQAAEPQPSELLERVVEATRYSVRDVETMANHVSASKLYNLDPDKAFTLMMLAEAEGIHPIQALRRFHIVEGRPSMRADAMQAEFQRHGGRLRWIESTAEKCSAEFSHPLYQPEPLLVTVTLKELVESEVAMQWPKAKEGEQFDARRGKVLKDTYKKFPRQMLRARVISEGVRAVDPGVVVGIYTPEEVSDFEEPRPIREPNSTFRGFKSYEASKPDTLEDPSPPIEQETPHPAPSKSAWTSYLQAEIDTINNQWKFDYGQAEKLIRSDWQVLRGVLKDWVEHEVITEERLLTDGKRDKAKEVEVFRGRWATHNDDVKAAIGVYLQTELEDRAKAKGINLDAEPVQEVANG
jgi:hypothetical protein